MIGSTKKCLITGVAGFIGSQLARRALELLPDSPEVKDTLRQVRKRAANKRGGAITRRPGLAENPAFARFSPEWRPERPRDGRSARGTGSS